MDRPRQPKRWARDRRWAGRRRRIMLPKRGTIGFREIGRRGDAPSVVLLHGWGATADVNFGRTYAYLGDRHIVAPDLRGHGNGIASSAPFSLSACADDVAALIVALDLGPVIVVGYSMGGPIALLLARRHPGLVAGLVLCATAGHFDVLPFAGPILAGVGGLGNLCLRLFGGVRRLMPARHDPCQILSAGARIGRFHAEGWLATVELPTAVILTTEDHLVPLAQQVALANGIHGAWQFPVAGGHDICLRQPHRFGPALARAITTVSAASGGESTRRLGAVGGRTTARTALRRRFGREATAPKGMTRIS